MNGRILYDIPRSQYDGMTDRVNWSTLKEFDNSALHYKHALDRLTTHDQSDDDEQTDDLLEGEAAHTAALEPDLYGGESTDPEVLDPLGVTTIYVKPGRYLVWPSKNGKRDARTKLYQAALARAQFERKKILTEGQHHFAQTVGRMVRTSPASAPYIVGGRREVTVVWDHVEGAVLGLEGWSIAMRTRLDYLTDVAIIDLKTTRSARRDKFARHAWELGYYGQAALHIDAVKAATGKTLPYLWIAVEKKPPYAVAVYEPSATGLELGRRIYRDFLGQLKVCRETGEYPSYADGVLELEPPRYAVPEEMLEAA
jgi:hypothetical protein